MTVRERPILFSGPMVRALLDGSKTQTRRVVTFKSHEAEARAYTVGPRLLDSMTGEIPSPYGFPGDRLWVKEAIRRCETDRRASHYVADEAWTVADAWPWKLRTLPAMFCPRGLSRLTLEITDVRVQRLHEITEDDAKAEGFTALGLEGCAARDHFAALWNSINSKRRFGWLTNPWVWALTFKRVAP